MLLLLLPLFSEASMPRLSELCTLSLLLLAVVKMARMPLWG